MTSTKRRSSHSRVRAPQKFFAVRREAFRVTGHGCGQCGDSLYAWEDTATHVVLEGANDPSWRVREMSAKVVARRGVVDAFDAMALFGNDPVLRVRTAAERALVRLAASET